MPRPNKNDPLFQCAAAYKSMSDKSHHGITGRDVKFEIEMIVPDWEESGVKKLKKHETFTVAFRESEFMHMTGKQHFSNDSTTKDSAKFLKDCLNGYVDMTTFAGQTYDKEKNGYGFLDRIEALKNFETLMNDIPQYLKNNAFGIFIDNSGVNANYVIEFKGNVPPVGTPAPAVLPVSYTSFFLVRTKDDYRHLKGMSCFTDLSRSGSIPCEILNITKHEKGKTPQPLLSASMSERESAINKISDYNNGKKANFVFEQIKQYREKMIKNPDGKVGKSSTNKEMYGKNLHILMNEKSKYPDEILLKLKEKYEAILKTADTTLKKHLKYELNAIDSILLVRHLEELRNDMIKTGDSTDYEKFFNLVDDVSETSERTQKFLSDNQIHGNFADYMPHMKEILSGILEINKQNKDKLIKKSNFALLTKEQEKYLCQEIELLDDEDKTEEKGTDISSSGAGGKEFVEFSVGAGSVAVLNPTNVISSIGKILHDVFNEFVDKIKEKFNQLKQIFHKPNKEESSETEESPQTGTESESEQERV